MIGRIGLKQLHLGLTNIHKIDENVLVKSLLQKYKIFKPEMGTFNTITIQFIIPLNVTEYKDMNIVGLSNDIHKYKYIYIYINKKKKVLTLQFVTIKTNNL